MASQYGEECSLVNSQLLDRIQKLEQFQFSCEQELLELNIKDQNRESQLLQNFTELKDWFAGLVEERLAGQGATPRPNSSSTIERQIDNIISNNTSSAAADCSIFQAKLDKMMEDLTQSQRDAEKKLQKQILGTL